MIRVLAAGLGLLVAGMAGALGGVVALELSSRLRRRRPPPVDPVPLAARLLVLVGNGVPVVPALELAAGSVDGVAEVVRRSRRLGAAVSLGSAGGPLAPLMRSLAAGAASGSAPEAVIRRFVETERRQRQVRAIEYARRLPVRLMVPMTLLVLPGFVLMVYGPALIDLVIGLLGPLGG